MVQTAHSFQNGATADVFAPLQRPAIGSGVAIADAAVAAQPQPTKQHAAAPSRQLLPPAANFSDTCLLLPLSQIGVDFGVMYREALRGFADLILGDGFTFSAAGTAMRCKLSLSAGLGAVMPDAGPNAALRHYPVTGIASLILMSAKAKMLECHFIASSIQDETAFLLLPDRFDPGEIFELISKGALKQAG